ncbi:hypothetical protein [Ectothiorhodospira lacustris]|uniref:hypothetical protein n=1 Tax=Ectothiorhodospira lacustris TaxID=2899127 RepID=UPI001EE8489F|nr:hypothetical protein [Ectothiorhodospira lacustris]MCG5501131.1 hypothetical protein [Ectothiorhodospira lacustris]MCG5511227.1 hypothetical protein [Ectothiorhodospira lacustris]MCG5522957.1 hypothetical protein [Ectothiorhodospira lacustris]
MKPRPLYRPLFVLAVALLGLVLLIELGTAISALFPALPAGTVGWGIPSLALLDAQLLFTALLMTAPLLLPERVTGRIQGVLTLIFSFLVLIACLMTGFAAFTLLMLLVGLLLAVPFGPVAYAALGYAGFPTAGAAVVLGLLMTCKLVCIGVLVTAHPRFLENRGLMLLVLSSLLATLIVTFLHALVPGMLVSVTDLIAAVIVAIIAGIWAVIGLVCALVAMIRAVA